MRTFLEQQALKGVWRGGVVYVQQIVCCVT
jgi:hypothetical protein